MLSSFASAVGVARFESDGSDDACASQQDDLVIGHDGAMRLHQVAYGNSVYASALACFAELLAIQRSTGLK